jgi:cell division protein FtsL
MLENGKILVVVVVLALILIGVLAYLFTIDRKVTKLEKEVQDKISDLKK